MKLFTIFISVVLVVNADPEQWVAFKDEHGKMYKSLREEVFRFKTFQENLRMIKAHNIRYEQGAESYMMGINQFTDLTRNELETKWSGPKFQLHEPYEKFSAKPFAQAASSVDWREKGAVLDVMNQGNCGGCWAFSAAGSIEGQNAIKHNRRIHLSTQELVDCSTEFKSGCNGGYANNAYDYIQEYGISAWVDYEYNAIQKDCKRFSAPRLNLTVTGYTRIDVDEEALRQAVEKIGPISVTFNTYYFYYHYKKGIFDYKDCPKNDPTHVVLIVGYGTENGIDYWIGKNSWGPKWGENGYFRIVRNKNNTCGICSHAMYPNII